MLVVPLPIGNFKIPLAEFEFTFVRSSGPGGQNVNKVNSKAVMRWNLLQSPALYPVLRDRLMSKLGSRLTREGDLIVMSDRFRDQLRNREDCLEKLREILTTASAIPKPRKKTKPSRSMERKAKDLKSRHSEKKRLRRRFED